MTNTTTSSSIPRISVRDYNRNYTKYLDQVNRLGKSFVITQKEKAVATIVPFEVTDSKKAKKYTIDDILSLRFNSGDKNMSNSKNIDKIVYGI
jgi:antitoxin (DNA-binding transcriptional repressor) of toxin-antitoxin stability system